MYDVFDVRSRSTEEIYEVAKVTIDVRKSGGIHSIFKHGASGSTVEYGSENQSKDKVVHTLMPTAGIVCKILHRATCALQIEIVEEKMAMERENDKQRSHKDFSSYCENASEQGSPEL